MVLYITHYPGALYHVMVKENNGKKVLDEEIHSIDDIKNKIRGSKGTAYVGNVIGKWEGISE